MLTELALVRHAFDMAPLRLVYILPDRILVEFLVERLTKTFTTLLFDGVFQAC